MTEAKKTKNPPPVARVKVGTVQGAIFARSTERGIFLNTTFKRGYRDEGGNWKDTNGYDLHGLLALQHAVGLAIDEVLKLKAADVADKPGDYPPPEDLGEDEVAF